MLAILRMYAFSIYFVYQSLPPSFSLIIEELEISYAQAGLTMSMFSLPAILLTIPVSLLSFRFSIKQLGLASLSLILLGSIAVMLACSFTVLRVGRLLIGLGAVAIPVIGLHGAARWFRNRQLGLAMGIHSTFMILAPAVSYGSFGNIGATLGWRATILITIVVTMIALIVFAIYYHYNGLKKLPSCAIMHR